MIFKKLQALFNPERYHGWGKTRSYFEGWYYKIINAEEDKAYAFIPGIAMDNNKNKQSFIQVLDGKRNHSEYHKFNVEEFKASPYKFEIHIGKNIFTKTHINLNLPDTKGELHFKDPVPWPKKWYSPGIMGPYSFVPFMECYHGILSMDHKIEGQLIINGEKIDFTNGKAYIEKDWGHSFPSSYIWMQTNHFSEDNISLKVSVAKIPWLGSSFVGFIAGLWLNNKLYRFTTYNSTKLIRSLVGDNTVEIVMENKKYKLEVLAERKESTSLASPVKGFMDGRINESMTSIINVILIDKKGNKVLFNDSGRNGGLEIAGNIDEISIN